MESKSEKLCNLLKNCNYPSKLSPNNLNYLFEFPDLKPFFEKFFDQVNESCYHSKEKLDAFIAKAEKGQVIYDVNKLKEMHRLLNLERDNRLKLDSVELSDEFDIQNCNDPAILKKKIELLEREIQLKRRRNQFNAFCHKKFNDNLKELRVKEEAECRINAKLDERETFIKSSLKTSNQSLNKSLIELKAKLGDDERINELGSHHDSEKIENYLVNENLFLKQIKKLMNLEIHCTDLNNLELKLNSESTESAEPSENEILEQKQFQLIMKKKFPKVMDKWIQMKIADCSTRVVLDEVSRIDNEFDQFFVYSEEELRQNENLVRELENKCLQNERERDAAKEKLQDLVRLMPNLINQLAYLKMVHLACIDLENKEINLNLFLNKQEKISKFLLSQKSRIDFIEQLTSSKLNQLENLKQMFCELAESNNISSNRTNASVLSTSIIGGAFTSLMHSNKNLSINQYSKQNLLSSTFNTSITNRFISSPSKNLSSKLNYGGDLQIDPNSSFLHLLNQFLITILTKFDQNKNIDGEEFEFRNPISINFDDNMENFILIRNFVNCLYKTKILNWQSRYKNFYDVILKSIEYLYEKEEYKTDSRFNSAFSYNLSKINAKMSRCLEDKMNSLNEQNRDLQNLFVSQVYQNYSHLKQQMSTNKLSNIRRNFFVHFYTNPKQIEVIMEQLNSVY